MGRDRKYESNAERQRAYRKRQAKLRPRGTTKASVPLKLVKVLGLLGSDQAGERDVAARMAMKILKDAGLTWYDVLNVDENEDD